jgi:hypothetical protein
MTMGTCPNRIYRPRKAFPSTYRTSPDLSFYYVQPRTRTAAFVNRYCRIVRRRAFQGPGSFPETPSCARTFYICTQISALSTTPFQNLTEADLYMATGGSFRNLQFLGRLQLKITYDPPFKLDILNSQFLIYSIARRPRLT